VFSASSTRRRCHHSRGGEHQGLDLRLDCNVRLLFGRRLPGPACDLLLDAVELDMGALFVPAAVLRAWLAERGSPPAEPLFPTSTGKSLTRKALARRVAKHAAHAAERCPSLPAKTITPHVLRHTAAMRLLHAGVDTTVIALWLGHEQVETTQMYLHADLAIKERALARTKPLDGKPGRYRPPDALLRFLDGL
jgi:integrase